MGQLESNQRKVKELGKGAPSSPERYTTGGIAGGCSGHARENVPRKIIDMIKEQRRGVRTITKGENSTWEWT